MCRVLAYLGEPVLVDDLLFQPDSSLVRQSYDPQMLGMLNLAGFGMSVWDQSSHEPTIPYSYKATSLPIFDANLKGLALKLRASCLLAHVRGVDYHAGVTISPQNLHPFRFDGFRLAMAHNGDLHRFNEMRFLLADHMKPEIARLIRGTTDSEYIYALLLSQFDDPTGDLDGEQIADGVGKMLKVLRRVRDDCGIKTMSPVNLFIADGSTLAGVRFTFDYGCYDQANADRLGTVSLRYLSLWYTLGTRFGLHDGEWKMVDGGRKVDSVLVASEPLSRDQSYWVEVPEYSMVWVDRTGRAPRMATVELDA